MSVVTFVDCLCLFDGRFPQLQIVDLHICSIDSSTLIPTKVCFIENLFKLIENKKMFFFRIFYLI